jgi:hypothetical protein
MAVFLPPKCCKIPVVDCLEMVCIKFSLLELFHSISFVYAFGGLYLVLEI